MKNNKGGYQENSFPGKECPTGRLINNKLNKQEKTLLE